MHAPRPMPHVLRARGSVPPARLALVDAPRRGSPARAPAPRAAGAAAGAVPFETLWLLLPALLLLGMALAGG